MQISEFLFTFFFFLINYFKKNYLYIYIFIIIFLQKTNNSNEGLTNSAMNACTEVNIMHQVVSSVSLITCCNNLGHFCYLAGRRSDIALKNVASPATKSLYVSIWHFG